MCEILGHRRDEKGDLLVSDDHDEQKDSYREEWLAKGLTEAEIAEKYAEDIDIYCYRMELARNQDPDIEQKERQYRARVVARRKWCR